MLLGGGDDGGVVSWSPPRGERKEPVQTATGDSDGRFDGRTRGRQGTGVNIWDGDGGRVLIMRQTQQQSPPSDQFSVGWMVFWSRWWERGKREGEEERKVSRGSENS